MIPGMDKTVEQDEQDKEDVVSSLRGDEEAYTRLLRRYEEDIARQMWRFTHDRGEHEILVHDVFVEAFFSLPKFGFRAPFAHWLRRIATHVGYGFWRQKGRGRKIIHLQDPDSLAGKPAPEKTDEGISLFGLLEKLNPEERLVLTLTYDEGLNAKQIAERMGWTHIMTRARLSRARKKLRTIAENAGLGKELS